VSSVSETAHRPPTGPEAQRLAERVAAAMFERDQASRGLGMRILRVGPGHAELTMTVRRDMVNGHHICHGGLVFTLADSAFAFACNSYNHSTVANGCTIEFLAPAHEGDVLTAVAQERAQVGRNGVYDIAVRNQADVTIALFRGKSTRIKGHVVQEDPPR